MSDKCRLPSDASASPALSDPAWRAIFDPFDPVLVSEPHDTYRRLRTDEPVH